MSCSRGAAAPDRTTALRLFAASAGYCQNPACYRPLFISAGTDRIHIAEMAHILAASNQGPRAVDAMSAADRGAFENLILLCANCHTLIDKAPSQFPDALLVGWKRDQQARLDQMFGAVTMAERRDVRSAIEPLLLQNRVIFEEYGPDAGYQENPESEMASTWQRYMRERIIPNNRRILAILDVNRNHLVPNESRTLELFRQHILDLEAHHLTDILLGVQRRFPTEMDSIVTDGEQRA
jgi:hypothetical protein